LALILENAFAIMETLKSMPTEAKELDEFWTGNPDPSKAFGAACPCM
jgi:U3 small nucleolar RNA-associated protein 19